MAETAFVWEGTDRSGRKIKGEMQGRSEPFVRAKLRRQNIAPGKIKRKSKSLFNKGKKIGSRDIAMFSRQMATMISSGVPIAQAFEIAGRGHENPSVQNLLLSIKTDVESGDNLTTAIRKHPQHFSDLYCNLIQAGEQAGILESILDKLATYMEKIEAVKSKIKSAMLYPAVVIVVACGVVTLLMLFVIPQFQELFAGFGADLPFLTQFLINTSKFFQEYIFIILPVVGIVIWGMIQLKKNSKKFNNILDSMMIRVPIFGPILQKSAIARFARTLETMFSAGTPLVEAMPAVGGACGNVVFERASLRIRDEISTGTQLQVAMRNSELFPHMVVQMVAIGEEGGAVDEMLGKVADWYEREVDDAVDGLSSLIEPLIIVILGVIIGGIVVGMYLPIFKMGSVI